MVRYSEEEQKFINIVDGGIASHEEIKDYYDKILRKHNIQNCTPSEWDSCRVEKMGCRGCYYDNDVHKNEGPAYVRMVPEGTPEESVLRKDDYYKEQTGPQEVKLRYDSELKIPECEEEPCVPDDCDTHFCLHCGKGIPAYCENCYQMLILRNSSLQLQVNCSFPKNSVMEFLDAMRAILINGEKPELQINKLSKLYIQYGEEFTK